MGGLANVVVKKDGEIHAICTGTSCVGALLMHPHFYTKQWEQFHAKLNDEENYKFSPWSENEPFSLLAPYHYGLVFIDWDRGICHQAMDDFKASHWYFSSIQYEVGNFPDGSVIQLKEGIDPNNCEGLEWSALIQFLYAHARGYPLYIDGVTYTSNDPFDRKADQPFELLIKDRSSGEWLQIIKDFESLVTARYNEESNTIPDRIAAIFNENNFKLPDGHKISVRGIRVPRFQWRFEQSSGYSDVQPVFDLMKESGVTFTDTDMEAWHHWTKKHEMPALQVQDK